MSESDINIRYEQYQEDYSTRDCHSCSRSLGNSIQMDIGFSNGAEVYLMVCIRCAEEIRTRLNTILDNLQK